MITDVVMELCSVQMSTRGQILHGLKYIGTTPAVGDSVFIDFGSGVPVVHTNSDNLQTQIDEVTRQVNATITTVSPTPAPAPEVIPAVDSIRRFLDTTAPTVSYDVNAGYEVGDVVINETADDVYICVDASAGAAVWIKISTSARMMTFATEGNLAVATGRIRIYNNFGRTFTITKVFISVNTAPTGAAILVDVNKNGTTLFTTQSNRPTIAISGFSGVTTTIQNNSFADGDYLQMDIDTVGSTITGSDLTVQVYFS